MFVTLLFFVFGTIIGSFITAYSYRLPKGISIASGRSFCPKCKSIISWKDNIPLLSYLLLRGKCRNCKKKISIRYPLIELLTGIGFSISAFFFYRCSGVVNILNHDLGGVCWWKGEFGYYSLIITFFIVSTAVMVTVVDLEKKIIPDELNFIPYLTLITILLIINNGSVYEFLLSGFVSSIFLLMLHIVTKGKGMGLGDVKFALFGGTLLGLPLSAIWMIFAFIIGAISGLILILFGKAKFGKEIPFGPYLSISLVITFLFGPDILKLLGLI